MNSLIPVWILGAPFVALIILAYSFKGPGAMGSGLQRAPHGYRSAIEPPSSAPVDSVPTRRFP